MERKISLVPDNYYHVYNRGVDKRRIFETVNDYQRFVALLYVSNSEEKIHISNKGNKTSIADVLSIERGTPLVSIGAYCLMPNHFHLLITPLVEGGISKFMLKLQTGYSMYFNIKNEREGSLFQGTYKATLADDDSYLKYLYAYIHLNPAKLKDKEWKTKGASDLNELKKFVEGYEYSSYSEYINNEFKICSPEKFPNYFEKNNSFKDVLDFWLSYQKLEMARVTLAIKKI